MSEEVENEDFLPVVMDGGDESKIISADVEHGDDSSASDFYLIGMRVGFPRVHQTTPSGGEREP